MARLLSATVLVILFCLHASAACAQECTYRISGTVTDNQRHPLMGAVVRIETDSAKGDVTDTGGRFTIYNACKGHLMLTCKAEGFSTAMAHIHIDGDNSVQFVLSADKNQLHEVVVNGVRMQDLTFESCIRTCLIIKLTFIPHPFPQLFVGGFFAVH